MLSYQRPLQHFTVDENFQRVEGHKANNASFARLALYHYVTRWGGAPPWAGSWSGCGLVACPPLRPLLEHQASRWGTFDSTLGHAGGQDRLCTLRALDLGS
jgi:hypothetical protein